MHLVVRVGPTLASRIEFRKHCQSLATINMNVMPTENVTSQIFVQSCTDLIVLYRNKERFSSHPSFCETRGSPKTEREVEKLGFKCLIVENIRLLLDISSLLPDWP